MNIERKDILNLISCFGVGCVFSIIYKSYAPVIMSGAISVTSLGINKINSKLSNDNVDFYLELDDELEDNLEHNLEILDKIYNKEINNLKKDVITSIASVLEKSFEENDYSMIYLTSYEWKILITLLYDYFKNNKGTNIYDEVFEAFVTIISYLNYYKMKIDYDNILLVLDEEGLYMISNNLDYNKVQELLFHKQNKDNKILTFTKK